MEQRIRPIYYARDGTVWDVPLPADASVDELQRALHERTGIAPKEQVLINEQGISLRANLRLGSPRNEAAIFLFNLHDITATEFSRMEVQVPVLSEISNESSMMAKSISEAFLRRADEMCEASRDSLRQQQVMARALSAARANLKGHTLFFTKRFKSLDDELQQTISRYRNTLESCEDSFQRLLAVEVPEILRQQVPAAKDATNLLETQPCEGLRNLEKYAAEGLQQVEARILELRDAFSQFVQEVDELSMGNLDVEHGSHFITLEKELAELVAIRESQYDSRKALGECSSDEARVEVLRQKMTEDDKQLYEGMLHVLAAKTTSHEQIHQQMQGISDLQTKIRKRGKRTSGYVDSLHSLDRYYVDLGHVEHIASAFEAGLAEARRRQAFKARYLAQVKQACVPLHQLFIEESERRKQFWQEHGVHLPMGLIPGLDQPLPQDSIEVAVFDTVLPDLGPPPSLVEPGDSSGSISMPDPEHTERKHEAAPMTGKAETEAETNVETEVEAATGEADIKIEAETEAEVAQAEAEVEADIKIEALVASTDESGAIPVDGETLLQVSASSNAPSTSSHGGESSGLRSALSVQSETEHEALQQSLSECRLNNAYLENQLEEIRAQLSDAERELEIRVDTLQLLRGIALPGVPDISNSDSLSETELVEAIRANASSTEELRKTQMELKQVEAQVQVWRQRCETRVTCDGFEINELAVFSKKAGAVGSEAVYEALNISCPHYYLQVANMGDIDDEQILGRITQKEKMTVCAEDSPFGLPLGAEYHLLTIERVQQAYPH